MIQQIVVGFALGPARKNVLLVYDHERCHWNGVGGKMRSDESFVGAMTNRFKERIGIKIPKHEWTHFYTAKYQAAHVHFFSLTLGPFTEINSDMISWVDLDMVDELISSHAFSYKSDLRFLIPMAFYTERVASLSLELPQVNYY